MLKYITIYVVGWAVGYALLSRLTSRSRRDNWDSDDRLFCAIFSLGSWLTAAIVTLLYILLYIGIIMSKISTITNLGAKFLFLLRLLERRDPAQAEIRKQRKLEKKRKREEERKSKIQIEHLETAMKK